MSLEIGTKYNFWTPKTSLRCIGIEVSRDNLAHLNVRWYFWLIFLLHIFRVCCAAAGSLSQKDDIQRTVEIWITLLQDFLTLWKAITFIITRSSVMKLVQELHMQSQAAKEQEFSIVLKELQKDHVLSKTYYVFCILSAFCAILAPVVSSFGLSFIHHQPTYILPFDGNYPINHQRLHNYIVLVLLSSISVHFAINVCVVVDSIYSWFVHSIAAQFQRLELRLKQSATKSDTNEDLLNDYIRYHQWIIDVVEKFAAVWRPVILVEISLSSFELCLIVFCIELGFSLHSTPFLAVFLIAVFIQLTIYCYAGQKLQDESSRVVYAIYDCARFDRKQRVVSILPLMRAQRPCKLDGVFFTVNFELLISVVRTAGSYLTMLKSMR